MCLLQLKRMKKVEQKLRRSNQLINLSFSSFPIRRESLITTVTPTHTHTHPPFSCPSLLCVCTAAISKSISCHFSFLPAQFCSLHLPQGDKLPPHGLGWPNSLPPLWNILSQAALTDTLSSRTVPTSWR